MSKNQKQSVLLGFDPEECRELLIKAGIPSVSKKSAETLNKLLTRRARELATKAVTLAAEKDRDEVLKEDITQAVRMTSAIATYEVGLEAPVIHYIWFISSGGTCLLSRSYSGLEFPDTIFSGLMTGILDLMSEVTGRTIEKFSTDDLTIHIRRISDITVAVICDSENSDPINELTDLLAFRFAEVFDEEIQREVVDTSVFDDFGPVLDALVAGAGLNIPKESLKIIKTSTSLTDKQLEESVDAVALREEIRRAQERIHDLALFKKDNDIDSVETSKMESLFQEAPDVTEIKAVIRQASQDFREEINNEEITSKKETIIQDVSQEEVLKEISKDFPEIAQLKVHDMKATNIPVREITNEPVRKITKKPVKKATKKPVRKITKKPVKKATKKPVKKATKKPVKKTTKKPVKKATKKPVKKTTKETVKKTTKKPMKKTTKETVKKTTKKPVKKTTKETVKKTTKKPMKKTTKEIVKKTTKKPVKKIAQKPVKKTTKKKRETS
ncbi:MAG: hypothetical protein ACXADY_08530 [Candidatus Hodarchaeales archaeon]|jgi:histone H3/H4